MGILASVPPAHLRNTAIYIGVIAQCYKYVPSTAMLCGSSLVYLCCTRKLVSLTKVKGQIHVNVAEGLGERLVMVNMIALQSSLSVNNACVSPAPV